MLNIIDISLLNGYIISFYQIVLPVLITISVIVIYSLIVGLTYRTLSKRDVFRLKKITEARKEYRGNPTISFLLGLLEYGIIFPVMTILWFSILSVLLFLLSKSLPSATLIAISVAIVGSTRIISYINEEIATDVAKLLPLAVLGTFLIDPDFFSIDLLYLRINEISDFLPIIMNYLAVPVLIEWILRIGVVIKEIISSPVEK